MKLQISRGFAFPGGDAVFRSDQQAERVLVALRSSRAQRSKATVDALGRATALLKAERMGTALSLLEYAQRVAPSDGGISLAIGLLRLALNDPRASEPLELLTARTDWLDIWMNLVLVRLRFGQVERAAVDLQAALSRNGAPNRQPYAQLATTVSERVGARGWCAINNAGRVIIGGTGKRLEKPVFLTDGQEVTASSPSRLRDRQVFRLPRDWQHSQRLEVILRGRKLIGSPIDVARVTRIEGFAELSPTSGMLSGWCWLPAERERKPNIVITSASVPRKSLSVCAREIDPRDTGSDDFAIPRMFNIQSSALEGLGEPIQVTGPHGRALYGSPLWPEARESAREVMQAVARRFPLRARVDRRNPISSPREREVAVPVPRADAPGIQISPRISQGRFPPVDIIIPVYRGFDVTLACIDSVRAGLTEPERIIVVSDGSPDQDLVMALSGLAKRGYILFQREMTNRGFPGAANIGLRLAAGHDVVLLNSDTLATPGWLTGLRSAVRSSPDIGTATPLSNDATIFSYPTPDIANRCPDVEEAAELAALARAANGDEIVEVPTGHGFCLYIRAECLEQTGLLREDLFAQGYGEENDFCVRARHLGWRHIAVPGVFVAHHGSQSFSAARDALVRRNLQVLNRLHVGYDKMIAEWQRDDPLAQSRRRIDLARLERDRAGREVVLIVTHDREGGLSRYVAERIGAITNSGRCPLLLKPANEIGNEGDIIHHNVSLSSGSEEFPNTRFSMPEECETLALCLRRCGLREIEVNSLVGHSGDLVDFILSLRVPFDVAVHDYSWFCPRITLTTGMHSYCGEPDIRGCRDCIADYGSRLGEPVSPDEITARSRRLFKSARTIFAPSNDAANRIGNRFSVRTSVRSWETPRSFQIRAVGRSKGRTHPLRICVVGAIGYEKGYRLLLACARIAAARNLPVEFVVVGYTCDDTRLLDTGRVRITGRYEEMEAASLIASQEADFAWLPAIWPETWSYVLTQIWTAELPVVVHDIGAPAERVCASGGGIVIPLNMPPERILALFLNPELFRPPQEQTAMKGRLSGKSLAASVSDLGHNGVS